jgi:hypothetical protein
MRPHRLTAATAAVTLLLAVLAAGCTNAGGVIRDTPTAGTTTGAASPLTSPSPTATSEASRILAQYRAFWNIEASAAQAPAAEREALLRPYATEPLLSRVLRGMSASDNLGQVAYGEVVPHPIITKIERGVASIRDCQDASKAGRKERDTGRIVTRGTSRDLAVATVKRGPDGVWRVATVDYVRGAKC